MTTLGANVAVGRDHQPVLLDCAGVSKSYPSSSKRELTVFRDLNLTVEAGEMVCLVGPSGCGKTTLLRLIAGLERWDDGDIFFDGSAVAGPDRDRGFVFQSYSSFPWLTVRDNILFGTQLRRNCQDGYTSNVDELIDLIGLSEFADQYPGALSGGMKQRVAISRALAMKPRLLLMDEPFGALDVRTRLRIQDLVVAVWTRFQLAIVLVTHDLEEAVFLADRIAVFGPRPSGIVRQMKIDLPRPRTASTRKNELFQRYRALLFDQIADN